MSIRCLLTFRGHTALSESIVFAENIGCRVERAVDLGGCHEVFCEVSTLGVANNIADAICDNDVTFCRLAG